MSIQQVMNRKKNSEGSRNNIINIRRSQLTKAAFNVVGRKGYYDFTIKDIAVEAGLSTGLVHYYFKNKEDLLLNLLKEMNKNITMFLNKEIEKSKDPVEKLKIFVTHAFDIAVNRKEYIYIVIDFLTQVNRNERMKRANKKLFKSYRDECAKILDEGMEKNIFKEMDVQYTATFIISIIQGLIMQYAVDDAILNYDKYTKNIMNFINRFVLRTD